MTLIAAIADRNKVVHMIGDRRSSTNSSDYCSQACSKIALLSSGLSKENILIGSCGNIELSMFCTQIFVPPPLPEDDSEAKLFRWCANDFRREFGTKAIENKITSKGKEGEQELPGCLLLAARGRIIAFERKVIPHYIARHYSATGSGEDYCLGAMHFMLRNKPVPGPDECRDLLLACMRTTVELKSNVGPPYDYMTTDGKIEAIEK